MYNFYVAVARNLFPSVLFRFILWDTLCISLIEGKSPSRSEHLHGKTAIIGTFFKDMMSARYFKASLYRKLLKKVPTLQFYGLYVPVLDETLYIITKCTVGQNNNSPHKAIDSLFWIFSPG